MNDEYFSTFLKSDIDLFVLTGKPGVGKSHTIHRLLHNHGVDYKTIAGHITKMQLFIELQKIEANPKISVVVFEDTDLNDTGLMNLIKNYTWKNASGQRIVSYYTTNNIIKQLGLQYSFQATKKVVFLANQVTQNAHLDALKSRSFWFDIFLSNKQVRDIIAVRTQQYSDLRELLLDFVPANLDESFFDLRLIDKCLALRKHSQNWKSLVLNLIEELYL